MKPTYTKTKTKEGHIILTPSSHPERTLIFIHGLGDNADSISSVFTECDSVPANTKIICVQSPFANVSKFNQPMNSWFDIKANLYQKSGYSISDVKTNSKPIIDLIETEAKFYKSNYSKIFIGGFSQGCCMSLYIAFSFKSQLGGVIALSGVLFPEISENESLLLSHKSLPIFIGHGTNDDMVNYEKAMQSYTAIKTFPKISFNIVHYEGHWVYYEKEYKLIKAFIEQYS